MKYIQSFESLNEAKKSTIHRAAKKGSYPAVIVVVQDGKVIHQEPVSTPDIAPATFNVMQEKYPKALLHLEDNTGKRLFSESVVTEAVKEVVLSNRILNFLEERGVIKASDSQKIHKDLTAFLKKNLNESVNEEINTDIVNRNINLLDKAADMAIKNPKGNVVELAKIIKKYISDIRNSIKESVTNESLVTEGEDTIGGLNKMANTDLERIADYADMIKDRMSQGQQLDAWMYSKISDSVKNLNSVHDTMDGNDGINEAKFFRLPKELDAMWELKNSVDYIVGKHKNGDDYKPEEMKTIEEFIKKIKQSAKAFKDAGEVKGTVYESVVNEAAKKINEAEVDLWSEVEGDFTQIYSKLNDLAEETTDSKWRKAIEGIIKALDVVETKMGQASSKLGVITVNEADKYESVDEAMDINDPVLMAIRARRTMLDKEKAAPKVKKISMGQYFKLMDKESDLMDQLKDASKEFEQLDSDMNQEAGQKGDSWSDADANRYGGDLEKLQTKIEKLALQKKNVQDQLLNYRMS